MKDIKERLDLIKARISEEDFLANRGLGNEVGFYFFCYAPEEEMVVQRFLETLQKGKLEPYRIIAHDIYEVFLEILEDKRVLKNVATLEERKGREHLLTQIQKIATPAAFIEKMNYAPHEFGDVLVLSGIGKVFPYIRSHTLLESMQVYFSDIPVVIFYPGKYDGVSPRLFDKFSDGHYYRAFDLL